MDQQCHTHDPDRQKCPLCGELTIQRDGNQRQKSEAQRQAGRDVEEQQVEGDERQGQQGGKEQPPGGGFGERDGYDGKAQPADDDVNQREQQIVLFPNQDHVLN